MGVENGDYVRLVFPFSVTTSIHVVSSCYQGWCLQSQNRNKHNCNVIEALINAFDKAPKIYLVESDSYGGPAERWLGIENRVFNDRVIPFSLSSSKNTKEVKIADEKVAFSNILFSQMYSSALMCLEDIRMLAMST